MRSVGRRVLEGLAVSLLAAACARGDLLLGRGNGSTGGAAGPETGDTPAQVDAGPASAQTPSPAPSSTVTGSAGTIGGAAGASMSPPPMAAPSSVSSMPPPARVPTVTGRASTGCGLELGAPQATIRVNGLSMRYVLDLPATYDKTQPYPLLMAFHGENVTAEVFRSQLGLTALAGSEAVVVHPEVPSDAVSWDPQRDIPLVDALRADLAARYCVDEDRVFAVGHGSGAWLVTMFGCMHGDELRGIALLSGAPPPGMCLGQPAAWLAQNASDAMTLGFGRGNRDFWGSRNGCDMGMAAPVAPSPCLAYGGCDVRSPVQYCEYSRSADPPSFAASSMWGYFRGLQP